MLEAEIEDKPPDNALEKKVLWSNVIGLTISWLIWNPVQNATYTYWQVFLLGLGATPIIISLISAVSTIILSISRIPGGYLTDKVGRVRLITTMTFVITGTYLMMAFAPSWEWILIANIISSIALFYQPALQAIIADSLPPEKRSRGYAVVNILPTVVTVISPYIALIFVSRYGIIEGTRWLLILSFIAGVIAGIVRLLTLKETIDNHNQKVFEHGMLGDMKKEYVKAMKIIWQRMKYLLIGYLLVGVAEGLTFLFQLYTLKYLMISTEMWAYLIIVSQILFIGMAYPFSILADKIGRKKPITFAMICEFIASVLIAIAPIGPSAELYVIAFAVLGSMGNAAAATSIPAMEADLIPQEIRGKAYAVNELLFSTIMATFQLVSGYLYSAFSPRLPFIISAWLWLLVVILLLKVPETLKKKTESVSENSEDTDADETQELTQ